MVTITFFIVENATIHCMSYSYVERGGELDSFSEKDNYDAYRMTSSFFDITVKKIIFYQQPSVNNVLHNRSHMKIGSLILLILLSNSLFIISETMTIKKRSVTIETIHAMCHDIYAHIVDNRSCPSWEPECLVGLSRGGLVPLGFLAGETMFNNRNVTTISIASYSDEGQQSSLELIFPISEVQLEHLKKCKSLLIVDDIADSGKTLAWVTCMLKTALPHADIRTATLFYKEASSIFKPDYYVEVTEDWIVFPWEKLLSN